MHDVAYARAGESLGMDDVQADFEEFFAVG
jgi:hypothetical protein